MTSSEAVTWTITYEGPPALLSLLLAMLEQEGLVVQWTRPAVDEERGLGQDITQVIDSIVAGGTLALINAAVRKFRSRAPDAKVKVEGEQDDKGHDDSTADD